MARARALKKPRVAIKVFYFAAMQPVKKRKILQKNERKHCSLA
jgi:hypothetical protein